MLFRENIYQGGTYTLPYVMEVGWLKKNEMHGDVPVSDMRYAFRAS